MLLEALSSSIRCGLIEFAELQNHALKGLLFQIARIEDFERKSLWRNKCRHKCLISICFKVSPWILSVHGWYVMHAVVGKQQRSYKKD